MISNLEALHKSGFIHCDIKPENILLGSKNRYKLESSQIVLIDFGLAKSYLDEEK
jgi:serine/threonine protein kinase